MDRNAGVGGCRAVAGVVATREGGVDRNANILDAYDYLGTVATREGGVDRNNIGYI